MNPSVLFVFILSILLGVLRAADLAFGTDAVTGLCVVGSVWWRYLALGIVVLAAVLVGRTQPSRSEAVRSRRPLAGILALSVQYVSGRSGCTDRAGRSFRSGRLCAVHSGMPVLRVAQHHGPLLAQPQRVEKALWRAVSGRGGQSAVLLERAAALYGEQLQLAPRDPTAAVWQALAHWCFWQRWPGRCMSRSRAMAKHCAQPGLPHLHFACAGSCPMYWF